MNDPRARIDVAKPVDLEQLNSEMDGVGLSATLDDDGQVVEVVAPEGVTVEALAAAVDAHEPPKPVDPHAKFAAAVEQATSLDDLKAALLQRP